MFPISHEVTARIRQRKCNPPTWRTLQERFKQLVYKRHEHVVVALKNTESSKRSSILSVTLKPTGKAAQSSALREASLNG